MDDVEYLLDSTNPFTWRRALKRLLSCRPDALLLPWWTVFWAPLNIYLVGALRKRGVPVHFFCHNVVDHDSSWWVKRLVRMALHKADGFITHTESSAETLRRLFPGKPIHTFPHPLYERFPAPANVPGRRARLELLFFGFVRPYKGLDVLIEALAKLPQVDFHLHIAGEWWMDSRGLERRMEETGIRQRVTLLPHYVDDESVAGLITLADAVVLPYREATGSGVAALALAHDTPVVASRVGGLAEYVVNGETCFLVEPEDIDGLADGIRRLLRPHDWAAGIARHKSAMSWDGLASACVNNMLAARHCRESSLQR